MRSQQESNNRSMKLLPTLIWLMMLIIITVKGGQEEMHIPSRLVIRYTPPVSVAVSKNHMTNVELHAKLNLSGILNPDSVGMDADDPDHVPMWLRCPGRLMAAAEPKRLLDILNDTVDVSPMDFMDGVHTVLILRGKQMGHVRLTLYWELTNATMCDEKPEELNNNEYKDYDDYATSAAMVMTDVSTNVTSENLESTLIPTSLQSVLQQTTTTGRPNFLNKTFVIMRGSSTKKRNKRSPSMSDNEPECETNSNCNEQDVASKKIVIDNGYYVHVLQEDSVLDDLLMYAAVIVASINVFLIGFRVRSDEIKHILKHPMGLSILIACQWLAIPLISYTIAVLLFNDEKHLQLGLVALGIAPTAVLSNSWPLILDSNVNLGVMMTGLSIVFAFFVMPAWLKILGKRILPEVYMTVPNKCLLVSLATLLVPLIITWISFHWRTSWRKLAAKIDRPAAVTMMLILNSMAMMTLWHTSSPLNWTIAIAGLLITSLGYSIAWTLATVCHMELHNVTTIALATAYHSDEIARAFIQMNFQKPDSDLSSVQRAVHILVTNAFVLLVTFISVTVKRKSGYSKRTNLPVSEEAGGQMMADNVAGIAEPLMINVVFSKDHFNNADETDGSYIANEPLKSDIMNQANADATNGIHEPLNLEMDVNDEEDDNGANLDNEESHKNDENNKTFNTFGK